jgi:hypothetical protein
VFEDSIRQSADRRQSKMTAMVKEMNPSQEDAKTFEGGFEALVHWFREKIRS